MDIGGTTTDIGHVVRSTVGEERRGKVEGIPISFALCEISSSGVGGSSILSVSDGSINVGPESVGAVPGPACFGRGGKIATMTDVNLLMGLLDSSTYFGGGLVLDVERARAAIADNIATPLGLSVEETLFQLHSAYEQKIANEMNAIDDIDDETVLLAFGGAGPMNACGVAEKAGINTVFVPKMASVFSAFGMGSCDIGQNYSVVLSDHKQDVLKEAYEGLLLRAERDMYAEGFTTSDYEISAQLVGEKNSNDSIHQLDGKIALPKELDSADAITLEVSARKRFKSEDEKHTKVSKTSPANSSKTRSIFAESQEWQDVPVYDVNSMEAGAHGAGPAIVEEDYFTCLVREGWEFVVTEAGDICLTKGTKS
jgi:N-methylhydantoinase A/oxoprolinase/acetone carboxylase beta subunit